MYTKIKTLLIVCWGFTAIFFSTNALPDLVVDSNEGTLAIGTTINVTGDTLGGPNNAQWYQNANLGSTLYWGSERVYQFTLTQSGFLSIESSSLLGDPDFFLLNSLGTVTVNTRIEATGTIHDVVFLDKPPPQTVLFGYLEPGVYYLSVDAFAGTSSGGAGNTGPFDINLSLSDTLPFAYLDLGMLLIARETFSIDTLGSDFDTELAVYSNDGTLIDSNDDEPGGDTTSEITFPAGLPAGEYFIALGSFDTLYEDFFSASSNGDGGNWILNSSSSTTDGALAASTVQWFRFTVENPAVIFVDGFEG